MKFNFSHNPFYSGRRWFYRLTLPALLCGGLTFSGCGSAASSASTGSDASASSEAAGTVSSSGDSSNSGTSDTSSGGTVIRIGSGQSCTTLDVTHSYDGWYLIRFGICQTLTKMNDDMTISGWLVEDDYSSNDDYTEWTFTVKDDITFSDGTPCTAEDIKASIEYVCENAERSAEYFSLSSVKADGQTLTIVTDSPEPILPNKLADPIFSIIDTSADLTNMAEDGPIGTGPFTVKSFDTTTCECDVVKNENYWGGTVQADEIDFIYTEDQTTLTNCLKAGEFDAVYNLSMESIGDFEDDDNYTIVKSASGRTTHGFMNQNGVLGDKALRQAILQNLDKETYCSTLLNGQYIAGKTLITSSADYGYDELTDPNSYDPDNAVKLLDDAGYKDTDGDGFRETPDGDPLEIKFTYYTGRPEQELLVNITCQDMAKIGIKITPDCRDTDTVMNLLQTGEYDMLCMSINVLNCADPENHMRTYFGSDGSYSTTGWDSTEYDALLEKLESTADSSERREIIMDAEQLLLDDGTCIFYCYPLMNFVTKNTVSGITSTPADYYWVSEDTVMK